MSVQTDKARLETAKTNLAAYLTEKNVTIPEGTLLDGLVDLLSSVPGGGIDFGALQPIYWTRNYNGDTWNYYLNPVSGEHLGEIHPNFVFICFIDVSAFITEVLGRGLKRTFGCIYYRAGETGGVATLVYDPAVPGITHSDGDMYDTGFGYVKPKIYASRGLYHEIFIPLP